MVNVLTSIVTSSYRPLHGFVSYLGRLSLRSLAASAPTHSTLLWRSHSQPHQCFCTPRNKLLQGERPRRTLFPKVRPKRVARSGRGWGSSTRGLLRRPNLRIPRLPTRHRAWGTLL